MNIHFDGSRIWQDDPIKAVTAVLDTKKTSYDWAPDRNP